MRSFYSTNWVGVSFIFFSSFIKTERARKELIIRNAIEYLNKGHYYEKSIDLLRELQKVRNFSSLLISEIFHFFSLSVSYAGIFDGFFCSGVVGFFFPNPFCLLCFIFIVLVSLSLRQCFFQSFDFETFVFSFSSCLLFCHSSFSLILSSLFRLFLLLRSIENKSSTLKRWPISSSKRRRCSVRSVPRIDFSRNFSVLDSTVRWQTQEEDNIEVVFQAQVLAAEILRKNNGDGSKLFVFFRSLKNNQPKASSSTIHFHLLL